MHELISIEKSKLLPIAAVIALLAAANWTNTTRQELFEINHDIERMAYVSKEERARWSDLDGVAYKIERNSAFNSRHGLVGPPRTWTSLTISRLILNLPQSATTSDVSQLIKIRIANFKATGCDDGKQQAMAVLGLRKPIDTKILLTRLHILDRVLLDLDCNHRYGQAHGMVYRISHFKLLNEMRAEAIARAKLIDDLTFGLL
jgi:hypothetical protein